MSENWLKINRLRAGIKTQGVLTARLNLKGFKFTRAAIGHWEAGRYPPPLDEPEFRKALASILKMSVPAMLTAAGYEITNTYSNDAIHAADIIDQLPEDKKRFAIDMLDRLIAEV